MIVHLHLCGPHGEGQRRLLDSLLDVLKTDNRMLIQAMLKDGRAVPDTMEELGLEYNPPTHAEAEVGAQGLYGLAAMVERGTFSCGDAAGWESAVMEEKYRTAAIPFSRMVRSDGRWHALYRTSQGEVDPVARWLGARGRGAPVWEALR